MSKMNQFYDEQDTESVESFNSMQVEVSENDRLIESSENLEVSTTENFDRSGGENIESSDSGHDSLIIEVSDEEDISPTSPSPSHAYGESRIRSRNQRRPTPYPGNLARNRSVEVTGRVIDEYFRFMLHTFTRLQVLLDGYERLCE